MPDRAVILLVEDDPDDADLMRRAFARAGDSAPVIHWVDRGEEVIGFMEGTGWYSDRSSFPMPDLIILDLGLPGMSGFDVLTWLKEQPGFKSIPVVILSSNGEPDAVNRTYEAGANSCITKPRSFESLVEMASLLTSYWLRLCARPDVN